MTVIGKMTSKKDLELKRGKMGLIMKVILFKVKRMEKVKRLY